MTKRISKWLALAALFMFAAATFQIADDRFLPGVISFGAAVCFASAASAYRRRETGEKQEGEECEK